jgi:transcriptional regulator with XRE-family HTH domain
MTEIATRLRKIIQDLGHTPASFADQIGVQRSSISHVLSGRNKPGLDFIQKALLHFPAIDLQWFITGISADNQSFDVDRSVTGTALRQPIEPVEKTADESKKKLTKVLLFYNDQTVEEFAVS